MVDSVDAVWSARQNTATECIEICHRGNVVAITQDPRFAMMVCDLFQTEHHRQQAKLKKKVAEGSVEVDDEGDGAFDVGEHEKQKKARLRRLEGEGEE